MDCAVQLRPKICLKVGDHLLQRTNFHHELHFSQAWLLLILPAALFTEQAQRTPDPQAQNGADLRSVCYFPLMSSTSQENASNPLLLPHLKVASLFPDHGHFAFLLSSVPKTKTRGNNWRSRNIKHRIHHAHTTSAE